MFSPRVEHVEAKPLGAVPGSVIISEVAWGGSNEWIELYNTTDNPININGWNLNDGANISLSGTIPAKGFYLVEDNEANVSPLADRINSITLTDTGETITLLDNTMPTAVVIDTANLGCIGCWYAGSGSPDYLTMQRVGTTADGSTTWISASGTPRNSRIDLALDIQLESISGNVPPYNVTFSVNIQNQGFGTATNVQVLQVIPVELDAPSYTFTSGSIASNTWTIPSLPTGATETMTVTASMTTSNLVVYSAQVVLSSSLDPDSTVANLPISEDDDDLIRFGSATLNTSNTVNNPTPNVGANVVFTINVSNPNLADATFVSVDAPLPAGFTYVSDNGGVSYDDNTGVWTIGTLPAGSSVSLNITAQVITGSTISYVAEVLSNEFANNISTASITPVPSTQADLSLTQTWSRSTTSSDTAIIQVQLTNQDPVNAATNVQVQDLLPSGLTYVSHTSGMNYNSSTGIWAVGTILGGASSTLSITVRVSASGTSTSNFAEVWLSDQFDIDSTPGNGDVGEDDSSSVEIPIADLSLTQTSDISGSNAVFTIRVTNSGPDDATGVVVSNSRLSNTANYTFISSTGGASYNSLTGQWTIGSLPEGATVTLVVTTNIVAIDENLAEISAVTEVDPDSLPGNNSRTEDDDAATPSANLSLTKNVSNINPEVGTNIIFTILVSNAGYATATNVEVKDILPSGLTYVSHTSGQTYSSSTGIWTVGTIPNGGSRELKITAKVASYGIRTNYAEVWKSDQSDPNSDPGDSSTTEDDDSSVTLVTQRAVLLNEIAWAGTGAGSLAEDEWIELYNPSDASITISGWTIRKNSCAGSVYITIDSGKSISRDGYFLLERGSTSTDDTTVSDVAANQIYTTSVPKLDDAGETLYLCDNSGTIIDTANREGFGTPPNPWSAGTAASPYGSMERQGNTIEKDSVWVTNLGGTRNGTNASGSAIYGTPGKRNSTGNSTAAVKTPTITPTPTFIPATIAIPPRPIINEVLARPGFDWNQDGETDVFDEFIEIKNLTAIDISLNGWKLDKVVPSGQPAKSFSLPDVTLKPGERVVFYTQQTNLLLSDGGETVRLVNASGKIYDAFTYELARAEDKSFCRLPDGTPGNSWFEDCIPTPNLSNTREGQAPVSPDNSASPFCNLPDTIPLDFFIPECNGYGGAIWNPFYWDFTNWLDKLFIQQTDEKWPSFIE